MGVFGKWGKAAAVILLTAAVYYLVLESRYGAFMSFRWKPFLGILAMIAVSFFIHKKKKGERPLPAYISSRLLGAEGAKRIPYLDYLRIIAAMLVIFAHVIFYGMETVPPEQTGTIVTLRVLKSLVVWCNPLFIMLSGAVLLSLGKGSFQKSASASQGACSRSSIGEFYERRFLRVLIPCFVYYLFYIYYSLGTEPFRPAGLPALLKGFLNNDSGYVPHFWLMFDILACYLSAPIFLYMVQAVPDAAMDGIALVIFLAHVVFTYSPLLGVNLPMETFLSGWESIFLLGYYFMSGAAMKHYRLFMGLGVLSVLFLILVTLWEPFPDYANYLYNGAPPMLFVSAACFLFFRKHGSTWFSKEPVFARLIAQNSFSILLFHWMILFDFVGNRLHIMAFGYYTPAGIVLATIFTTLFSLLFGLMLDNTIVLIADEFARLLLRVFGKICQALFLSQGRR